MRVIFTVDLDLPNPHTKLSEIYDWLKQQIDSTLVTSRNSVGLVCVVPDEADLEMHVNVSAKWIE